MADYQITEENLGKQCGRTAATMLALKEFDEKLHDFMAADGDVELTTAQRNKIKKAFDQGSFDETIDACLTIRANMLKLISK